MRWIFSGEKAVRQILEDAKRIADRMEPGPYQAAILKSITDIQTMLDELADLRSKGQVSRSNIGPICQECTQFKPGLNHDRVLFKRTDKCVKSRQEFSPGLKFVRFRRIWACGGSILFSSRIWWHAFNMPF